MNLRPYQQQAVNDIREAFKTHRRVLYQLPTGAGKTVIFTYITREAARKSKSVLILVHRQELMNQTCSKLAQAGVPFERIESGKKNTDYWPVDVAMVQTASRRELRKYDLIICDEAHHAVSGSWHTIINNQPQAFVLGVTATPCRLDGRGLFEAFDKLLEGVKLTTLINDGYLCAPKIYASKLIDLTGVKTMAGDYSKSELETAVNKSQITGDAVTEYRNYADGLPTIVFCVSVKHAEQVAESLRDAGYRAESVDGSLPDPERKRRINGLSDGSVQVLTSCDIVSEGTDIPAVACAIMLRPTKSESLYLQQVGRALRIMEGKQHAIILDHAGNVFRHGMPTAARQWTLEGRTKKQREAAAELVRQCKMCYAVHQAAVCPECGSPAPAKPRKLKQVAGQLVAVEDVERVKREAKIEVWGARSLEELKAIAFRRGYKPGWAYMRWQLHQKSQR